MMAFRTTSISYEIIIELLQKIDSKVSVEDQPSNQTSTKERFKPDSEEADTKPKLFIGSSVEGLKIAKVIQSLLKINV